MRPIVSAFPTLLGLLALLTGSQTWVITAEGQATGSELFSWLWLPPLLSGISMIFMRYSAAAKISIAGLVSTLLLGFSLVIGFYDWRTAKPIIDKVAAHTGVQLESLSSVEVSAWPLIGAVLLSGSGILGLLSALRRKTNRRAGVSNGGNEVPLQKKPDSDPREIWDEQTD